jgi:ATP-dependent Clp protease ATP-binding subunit ClpB
LGAGRRRTRGARPPRRLIQREVVDRVAKAVIEGEARVGDAVTIDLEESL